MKNLKKINRGFTIIELMIVLAIAGLILAIVFIAVPQLQRNARDNQRQNISTRVAAELETYASNNQGLYPFASAAPCNATTSGCIQDFTSRYIAGKVNIKDPSTGTDVMANPPTSATNGQPQAFAAGGNTLPTAAGQLAIVYGAKCNGEGVQASGTAVVTTRQYAVLVGLDRGNRFCVDNG